MSYIVYWCEPLRDGIEEGVYLRYTLADALMCLNDLVARFGVSNHQYRLFELGKQIPLVEEITEEPPQPVKTRLQYQVKRKPS